MAFTIELSGDVHPQPGPTSLKSSAIPVITTCRSGHHNHQSPSGSLPLYSRTGTSKTKHQHRHNYNNLITIITYHPAKPLSHAAQNTTRSNALEYRGQRKRIGIAHLNAGSLKNRERFAEVKDLALDKNYDILSFSETWFNTSVVNASVHLEGYNIFRLDRTRKIGGGVCAYVRSILKVKVLKDLTRISDSGMHRLWLQIQHKHLRSVIVFIAYRPPDSAISCLSDDLMPSYTHALTLNKFIILTGDLNCDLLKDNPRGTALRSFCTAINATQLIKDPTRIAESSRTLIDIVLTSDPNLVKDSAVLDITVSDHFLVYAVLDLKIPKRKARYVTIRSYKSTTPSCFLLTFRTFHGLLYTFWIPSMRKVRVSTTFFCPVSTNMPQSRP